VRRVAGLAPDSSFDELFKRVEPRLKRVLVAYRIPSEDAEDLLQQSLLALLYRWQRVRDPESWLAGTLKRHCLMYWRNQRRRIYSAVDATILELLSRPVEPPQQQVEMLCDLERLIGRLPLRCRSLLRLRFLLGYEAPEAAAKLGYRASSIRKITTRCLAALSREIRVARIEGLYPCRGATTFAAPQLGRVVSCWAGGLEGATRTGAPERGASGTLYPWQRIAKPNVSSSFSQDSNTRTIT
jgi:RNA polymerase sigma factor (sigma-70 family)